MRARKTAWPFLVLIAILCAGCGGGSDGSPSAVSSSNPVGPTPTPTPPSPPPSGVASLAGTWIGTSDFQQNGVRYISDVTMTLGQNDRQVTGSFQFTSPGWTDWRGSINGQLAGSGADTQFVGTVTIQEEAASGTGLCVGTVTMAGRSGPSSMRWEAPDLTMTPNVATQPAHVCRGRVFTLVWIQNR